MSILDLKLVDLTVGEYFILYGGLLMLMGLFFLGIQILMWRDKYK